MESRAIFVLLGLLAATAVLAEAYRWVDESGVVHYSDRPQPGAERIDLPKPNVATTRRRAQPPAAPAAADTAAAEPFRYESIEITAPVAEETLWNIEGVLNVSVAVRPGLQPGHRIRVYLDGAPQPTTGLRSIELREVYRGSHTLQAEVLNETGQMMIRSRPSVFYVQQNTVRFGG